MNLKVKKLNSVYILLLLVLVLAGCAKTPPKPVKPARPDWTSKEPAEAGGKMAFVGISTVFSTEQSARDNAFELATSHVVKYIGTNARGKVERLAKNYGLKDDRINETISGRSFQEQVYGAVSRRLKAKEWYYEIKSDGYLYFVLTEIPTDELDLHKLSAPEAEVRVRNFLQRHVRSSRGKVVYIITGKGSHSDGPPVLTGLVNELLREEFRRDVVESAGLVGGGAIAVRIKG